MAEWPAFEPVRLGGDMVVIGDERDSHVDAVRPFGGVGQVPVVLHKSLTICAPGQPVGHPQPRALALIRVPGAGRQRQHAAVALRSTTYTNDVERYLVIAHPPHRRMTARLPGQSIAATRPLTDLRGVRHFDAEVGRLRGKTILVP